MRRNYTTLYFLSSSWPAWPFFFTLFFFLLACCNIPALHLHMSTFLCLHPDTNQEPFVLQCHPIHSIPPSDIHTVSARILLRPCLCPPSLTGALPRLLAAVLHKPSPFTQKLLTSSRYCISNAPHLPCKLKLARCIQPHRFLRGEPIFCPPLECTSYQTFPSFLFLVSPNEAVPYRALRPRCQVRVMEGYEVLRTGYFKCS